jgi:hypothetical protein
MELGSSDEVIIIINRTEADKTYLSVITVPTGQPVHVMGKSKFSANKCLALSGITPNWRVNNVIKKAAFKSEIPVGYL